jgi:hypothetical protein
MGRFIDRIGRTADALQRDPLQRDPLQRDSAACEPLVGDGFLEIAGERGANEGLASLLTAADTATAREDVEARERHLRQLPEGGGCDYDEVDPGDWTHRPHALPAGDEGGFLEAARERLQADFQRIIGRLKPT